MPVPQELSTLSGPRKVLLGGAALLVANSTLPWYRIEVRGFAFELSGWHELGILAWVLAIVLLVWELGRLTSLVELPGDRGDRWSSVAGMSAAFVGLLFVLRRLLDGDLGYAWVSGAVLVAAVGSAAWTLFVGARGLDALSARFGGGAPPPETRPLPDPAARARLGEPEWRHERPAPTGADRRGGRVHRDPER
ncbi:hypothetical protein AB0L40_26920, partial [Patulibacter sp. NPDC049589]|uniref:hypothetical protein n=1 Tax=Patulibacter sp. NPDC049589 TaxID=3154731 RepID=UPI003427FED6